MLYMDEVEEIKKRYIRRKEISSDRYDIFSPWMYMHEQDKERAIIRLFNKVEIKQINNKVLLEIGCGNGNDLLKFMRFGFSPENLIGNELITERAHSARQRLPSTLKIIEGNALDLNLPLNSIDIIYQSMVFSSILDDSFQKQLAIKIWSLVKVGGAVIWYDFIYNNPKNKDVRGIPLKKVLSFFPSNEIIYSKISLAPPLARAVSGLHFRLYDLFNSFRFLRTHILCWIKKPG